MFRKNQVLPLCWCQSSEIFGKFATGTKQRNHSLKNWDNTPLHEAATNGHVAVYQLIMDNYKEKDKNPIIRGSNVTPLH